MTNSVHYYGVNYRPHDFINRTPAEYFEHKIECGKELLENLLSAEVTGTRIKDVANAIEDNEKLLRELKGEYVEWRDPDTTPKEYQPKDYLKD